MELGAYAFGKLFFSLSFFKGLHVSFLSIQINQQHRASVEKKE